MCGLCFHSRFSSHFPPFPLSCLPFLNLWRLRRERRERDRIEHWRCSGSKKAAISNEWGNWQRERQEMGNVSMSFPFHCRFVLPFLPSFYFLSLLLSPFICCSLSLFYSPCSLSPIWHFPLLLCIPCVCMRYAPLSLSLGPLRLQLQSFISKLKAKQRSRNGKWEEKSGN